MMRDISTGLNKWLNKTVNRLAKTAVKSEIKPASRRPRRLVCESSAADSGGANCYIAGSIRTRPMKDRLREAVFNLIGDEIEGTHAIDLFAGTGALGLEALSRGAARATLIEQHYPTADIIRQNVLALGVQSQTEIVPGNVFIWNKRRGDLGKASWLVFCSPPYDFYVSRLGEMLELLGGLIQAAPEKVFLWSRPTSASTLPCCPIRRPGMCEVIRPRLSGCIENSVIGDR